MKVIVVGGGGQVARAVEKAAPPTHHLVVRTRAELDIADERSVNRLLMAEKADWIVNGAAYTSVDLAEDNSSRAVEINDTAVGILARSAADCGSRLLHLSTDFVFDGATNRAYLPSDTPNPINVYGRSKLAGERRVLDAGAGGLVLRTAWVYSSSGNNFVLTMLRLMRERETINVVCNQIGSPTLAASLAGAIWKLIEGAVDGGIYHWTDLGVASWYDFAIAIQDEAIIRGMLNRAIPIIPIQSRAYECKAERPAFSLLNSDSTRQIIGLGGAYWRDNLRNMLDELRAA